MLLNKIRKIIRPEIVNIGQGLFKEFKKFDRSSAYLKDKSQIVTKFDLLSEKKLVRVIKRNFPNHDILSEEGGDILFHKDAEFLWIIDPIDGTTNFTMHNPIWSISVALLQKNKRTKKFVPVLGFVYGPVLDEMFEAEINKGAFLNNKKIKVSNTSEGKIINTFCHGGKKNNVEIAIKYFSYQKKNGFDCRQLGSAALELAYVASGRIESLFIPGPKSWDVAAGALIVKEAEGKVINEKGDRWTVEDTYIVASNKKVYSKLINIVKRVVEK